MGRYIIKPHKDLDLYIEWSTVVDAPLFVGSRVEITEYLTGGIGHDAHTPSLALERLDRADERGSSMLDPTGCDWDSVGLIPCTHRGQRWLRRGRLGAYCLLVMEDDPEGAYALTEPLEDQQEAVILTWEPDGPPDIPEIHRAVNDISEGRVHIREVQAGADDRVVVVSDKALDDEQALAAYRDWEVNGE